MDLSEIPEAQLLDILPSGFANELKGAVSALGLVWIIQHFGGRELYVPATLEAARKRFSGLSETDLQGLCREAGRDVLEIPAGARLKTFIRNQRIYELLDQGVPHRQIAKTLNTTERNVRMVRQKRDQF